MTDSPRLSLPIDPEERPIEGQLLQIRSKLELLKADKSNYVKSEDVVQLYEEVIVQVNALNEIRKTKRYEQNRGACNSTSTVSQLPRKPSWGGNPLNGNPVLDERSVCFGYIYRGDSIPFSL